MEIIKLARLKLPDGDNGQTPLQEISTLTGTSIVWEKGTVDVIKISGPLDKAKLARTLLLQKMELVCNRLILKMDIPYNEHHSLIGKAGRLVTKLMEETDTKIHFPDGNKSPLFSKSNHVSIAGSPVNVERARIMLRSLLPLEICFQVPKSSHFLLCQPSNMCYEFVEISIAELNYSYDVKIRCCQGFFPDCRKWILKFMETVSSRRESNLPEVEAKIFISSHSQSFIRKHILDITRKSAASVTLSSKEMAVKMRGDLDCVYAAWQEVVNNLPIYVSFDVNETRTIDRGLEILSDCSISVCCRPKLKYHIKNVSMEGPEKFSKQILQYRQHVLNAQSLTFDSETETIVAALNIYRKVVTENLPQVKNSMDIFCNNIISTSILAHYESSNNNVTLQNDTQNNCCFSDDRAFESLDYYQKKFLATKAMHRQITSNDIAQIPSSLWAGYGFSNTMPASILSSCLSKTDECSGFSFDNYSGSSDDSFEDLQFPDYFQENVWSDKKLCHSNYFDGVRKMPEPKLTELLWQHGLYEFIEVFSKNEMDLETFLWLEENDLVHLSIGPQARLKIMALIKEIKEEMEGVGKKKNFDAAPGAERKSAKLCGE